MSDEDGRLGRGLSRDTGPHGRTPSPTVCPPRGARSHDHSSIGEAVARGDAPTARENISSSAGLKARSDAECAPVCIDAAGNPRFDLHCVCRRAVDLLPAFDSKDADIVALYDDAAQALATRADAAVDSIRVETGDFLEGGAEPQRSRIRIAQFAPVALAYAGVLAYVLGRLYLEGYNGELLPRMSFDYAYFPTVSSLSSVLPLLVLAMYLILPRLASDAVDTERTREFVRRFLSGWNSSSHYIRLIERLSNRRRAASAVRSRTVRAFVAVLTAPSRLAYVWMKFRQRLAIHHRLSRLLPLRRYLPLAVADGQSMVPSVLVMGAASLNLWVVLSASAWLAPWGAALKFAGYIGVLVVSFFVTVVTSRVVLLTYRSSKHSDRYLALSLTALAAVTLMFLCLGLGQVQAQMARADAADATVLTTSGSSIAGRLLSTPSSSDIFLSTQGGVRRIPVAAVASVQTVDRKAALGFSDDIKRIAGGLREWGERQATAFFGPRKQPSAGN